MKKYYLYAFLSATLLSFLPAHADDSESFLLFGKEAQIAFDSLPQTNPLTRAILCHNIAFDAKKNKITFQAENLFASIPSSPLTHAYQLSLRIMHDRDCSIWDWLTKKNDILNNVRMSYDTMSIELAKNPGDDTLRYLHAGTAIEITDYFPSVLPDARADLDSLWHDGDQGNTARLFFLNLLEAKYYCKLGKKTKQASCLDTAYEYLLRAKDIADHDSSSHYKQEVDTWAKRIGRKLPKK